MGNEVEARTQCVRDHLQRPDHSDWQLTNARIRSTVYLTAPYEFVELCWFSIGLGPMLAVMKLR
jgi:hypothetical protein